jgi:hypothetical protein
MLFHKSIKDIGDELADGDAFATAFGDWIAVPLGFRSKKNPRAEIERGDDAIGGTRVGNAQQFRDAYNNSRPLGSAI